ncbi:MAG: hypothetical protein L6Q33_00460 [Bacteriovoracaceae bacterium]|nr:hypothetical protein [Bacteriovoracaceae bacterium]
MGSYCDLKVKNLELLWNKSDVIGMDIFRPEDKKIILPTNEDEHLVCKYSTPVSIAIDRLTAMGYKAEDIKIGQKKYIDELKDTYLRLNENPDPEVVKRINDFSFNSWQDTIRLMLAGQMSSKNPFELEYDIKNNLDIISNGYMDQSFFGVNASCFSTILAILELIDDKHNTYVTLDYSDLVGGGFFEKEDELCRDSDFEKTVILTEGITDRRFIERSLKILYPHLFDYYSFLDFQELKLGGSASSLVYTIKAFSAAGIKNRIVAVFDNDTAAIDAMRPLNRLPIAKNIRIVTLPSLEFLNNYPTIGPQGLHNINVNGLAGSIELYFEESSLKDENQKLIPVVWKGFNESEQKYQGEISKKCIVHSQFEDILSKVEAGESISNYNFDSMKKVFETIFGFKPIC